MRQLGLVLPGRVTNAKKGPTLARTRNVLKPSKV
jgi:hypothetical protein